ncbi:MAG: ZIP family metal transporter [Nitrospiraceae bacterium]
MVLMWILGFALIGSVGAIGAAALFLAFSKNVRERLVPFLVSYATGSLLGAALLGLLPEAIEQGDLTSSLGTVLVGLLVLFVLERLLIWRHCHAEGPCEVHGTAGSLILVGDALHNFVDGAVIAAAFMSSVPLGVATGIAVIAHELPQEVGDFAILLDNGFTRMRALKWNLISGITTIPARSSPMWGCSTCRSSMPQFWLFRRPVFSTSDSLTSCPVFIGESGLRLDSCNYS